MNDVVAKILVKVYLVGGKEITHTYSPPKTESEMQQLIKDMVDKAFGLTRGEQGYLYFDNPNITYNPDNVLGIEFSTVGVKALEAIHETIRKAQTKIGYIKDK